MKQFILKTSVWDFRLKEESSLEELMNVEWDKLTIEWLSREWTDLTVHLNLNNVKIEWYYEVEIRETEIEEIED